MSIPSGTRHALLSLRKSWGSAALFVLALALGLSAVNTVFSVLNTVMLRPLPFKHADRLVTITESVPFMGSGPQICTLDEFQRWQKSGLLDYATAINTSDLIVTGRDRAELLSGAKVTPDFFRVFGISPLLGRDFRQEDEAPGHERSSFSAMNCRRAGLEAILPSLAKIFSSAAQPMTVIVPPGMCFAVERRIEAPSGPGSARGAQYEDKCSRRFRWR